MTPISPTATLGVVLTELGAEARLVVGSDDDLERTVTGASLVTGLELPENPGIVLICPPDPSPTELAAVISRLDPSLPRVLLLTAPIPTSPTALAETAAGHVIVEVGVARDPASAVLAVA